MAPSQKLGVDIDDDDPLDNEVGAKAEGGNELRAAGPAADAFGSTKAAREKMAKVTAPKRCC